MKKIVLLFIYLLPFTLLQAQGEVKIDTSSSYVKWTGSSLFRFNEHYGTVKFIDGEIIKDKDSVSGGHFNIDMNSIINTDGNYNKNLVNHLKGKDFFNVEKYPIVKLVIKKTQYLGINDLYIYADLTIKDITETIKFKASVTQEDSEGIMSAKFIIDRTVWKVNYKSKSLLSTIKDETISDAIEFEVVVKF